MKRILIAILAILCCLPMAACSKGGNGTDTSTKAPNTGSAGGEGSPVPDNLDFDNVVLNVGVRDRDDIAFELDPTRTTVDKLSVALENRNTYTQDKLNLSFNFKKLPGTYAQKDQFMEEVRRDVQLGGDGSLDILFGPNYSLVELMLEGYFLNLYNSNELKYLELESPYWNTNFINECEYAGKLYMLEGELTLTMLDSSFVMFCDTENFKSKTNEDLYDIVRRKEWTFEKLQSFVREFGHVDKDGDEKKSDGDFVGMVSPTFSCGRDGFPTAFGVTVISKGSDGKIALSFESERNVNIYSEFYRFVTDNEGLYVNGNLDGARDGAKAMFTSGNTVFITELLHYGGDLRSQKRDYGIFPLPMYDEEQGEYYTHSEAVHSQISVMKGSKKHEAVSAALEELGYQTHALVIDEYFAMVRYINSRESESVEMLNIILNSITCTFGTEFSTQVPSPFPTPIGSSDSLTDLSAQTDAIKARMNTLKKKIQALD